MFKRHLFALLQKNASLKRRHPCSLLCELFLAIGAIALLALTRHLTAGVKAREFHAAHHIEKSLPVHLPECAEFISDCDVELIKKEDHSPTCVKGVTFGCQAGEDGGIPTIWVSFGCHGTFLVEGGKRRISCAGHTHSHLVTCPLQDPVCLDVPAEEKTDCGWYGIQNDQCTQRGCCYQPVLEGPWCHHKKGGGAANHSQSPKYSEWHEKKGQFFGGPLQQLMAGTGDQAGVRRLDAVFAIAPAEGGGRAFHDWLVASGHPWAPHVRLFPSSEAIQGHLESSGYPIRDLKANKSDMLCSAVIFDSAPWSEEVKYTLRFNRSLSYDPNLPPIAAMMRSTKLSTKGLIETKSKSGPAVMLDTSGIMWYTQSGFLALQRTVDTFIEEDAGKGEKRSSSPWLGEDGRPHLIVPFPTPGWVADIFAMLMPSLLSSFLLISLAYSVNRMITGVVHEREARLKDGMRMMGMHPAAFYSSWILTYALIYVFVVSGVVIILSWGRILPLSSPSLLWVWLMLSSTAAISYGLVITTFFSRAKTAATVGSIAFYTSSYFVHLANASTPKSTLLLLSLLPPVCFELGADLFASLESQQVGIVWSNASLAYKNFSILESCGMMAFDTVALFILFLYLDQVMPREIGLQRRWYFPVLPSFWAEMCGWSVATSSAPRTSISSRPEVSALVEQEVGEAAAMMSRNGQTVELLQLSKNFGSFKAVQSLDLVMYQGEIFALLGHNGAGKTTTLAMLCGLMPPSSGSCVVFGHDGIENPQEVVRLLGVCPQHDVLWEELTCEEHLRLFAGFKGVPREAVAQEVSSMLERVGLTRAGAAKVQAGRLSGGMKRKLSLGIAFLGGSSLVVLDEPTSGLDPYSRRAVWELLRAMKQGRVTVLSTHYMDEADILGDRIAILHEGRLRCCGSPHFLKRAYDCGYNVTFVKRAGCATDAVREAVCRHVPELTSEVTTLSDSGKELILQFPFAAARHFPLVLGSLEQQLEELRLESWGISVTTLEEVFLKVASGDTVSRSSEVADRIDPCSPGGGVEYIELDEVNLCDNQARVLPVAESLVEARQAPASCFRRFGTQTRALLLKRWRYGLRDKRSLLCQLLLPLATLLLFLFLMSQKLFSSEPMLELSAKGFNEHCSHSGGPQNVVDFSHLPSVGVAQASAVLEPGKAFWNGDLLHHKPASASDFDKSVEEAAFSTLPALLRNAMQPAISKALSDTLQGRRLDAAFAQVSQEELLRLAEAKLLHAAAHLWTSLALLRGSVEEIAASLPWFIPENVVAWTSSWVHAMENPAEVRRLAKEKIGKDLFSQLPKLPRLNFGTCPGASSVERMAWSVLDRDNDGVVSKQDIHDALENMELKANFKGKAHPVTALLRDRETQEFLQAQGVPPLFDSMSEEELQSMVTTVAEDGVMLMLDRDGDGTISPEEFCAVGERLRKEQSRLYDLAKHFSKQILASSASSTCPRYGAYYVVAPGRGKDSPPSPAGADAVIFVNTTSSHSPAVFQAALSNARLTRLGKKKSVSINIQLFPQTANEQLTLERFAVFMLAIYVTFCLSFIPAGIAHFLVKERTTGARQLQALSGASHLSYWFANFTYDVALYVPPAVSVPLALHYFRYRMLLEGDCGLALAAVLTAFGPAIAGFSYLVSFIFKDHSKASNAILTFCLIGAIVLSTVLFVLSVINYDPTAKYPNACDYPTEASPEGTCRSPGARQADRILGPLFRLVPTVCVYQALFSIALVANLKSIVPEGAMEAMQAAVGEGAPKVSLDPFAYEWAGEPLCYLLVEALVFFVLTVLLDSSLHSPLLGLWLDAAAWQKTWRKWRLGRGDDEEARERPLIESDTMVEQGPGDDSVWAERERAAMVAKEELALHVWSLEKVYQRWLSFRSPSKNAVRGLSFAIHSGEVFGLLGHNGAGKTSAIKCFVGEQCCTSGSVNVGGCNMESDTSKARQRLGYCPQFDALLELLTVQDHLELFARVRGLPTQAVQDTLCNFKLEKMARRRAEVLSGGNKRKLSAAIALMGAPALAILDEPSCGLDPAARRALWTAVHAAVARVSGLPAVGKNVSPSAVLLTTHSMEEAEALSNRLGIMAEGRLLTVGTAQQIKQRHGSSHELVLTLRAESEQALTTTLNQLGDGALSPNTPLDLRSVWPLLEADAWKRLAYQRPRCVVRMQIEQAGTVEASVLAEWWLQQAKGEAIEKFLSGLIGDRAELAENFGLYWRFRLSRSGSGLPELFRQLEERTEELGIAEYTLSQATLEQIFNSIAEGAEQSNDQVAAA
eukprot:TRINITY_DN61860_c0_g1_i1.p1 TRINITY_DN61860_c0_g1~~TRINITY_DN61860_c0_g1_i1.p1  ORF type:complete len:2265 (+),score=447.26 TRINITY_DN61860_c0_g1_i1:78-6872(+)